MKRKFIIILFIVIFITFVFTYSFASATNEFNFVSNDTTNTEIHDITNSSGSTNSSSTENTTGNNTIQNSTDSSSTTLPETGTDDSSYTYSSSNPDYRKSNTIKRTLTVKEVSQEEFFNSQYKYEYVTDENGKKYSVGTLRFFGIVDSNNNIINQPGTGNFGMLQNDIKNEINYINKYFLFESYQYVGEEFTIPQIGTFTCQGVKKSVFFEESYYIYTSKITSNDFKKQSGTVSYFELLEKDIATNEIYKNDLIITYYGEIPILEDVTITNEETGIKLDTNTDAVPKNTTLVVNTITSGDTYKNVQTVLNGTVSKMYVYDISLKSEGVEIQPNGKVKISIPVPSDVDTSKLVIYRITDNGEKIEYTATIETIDGIKYATFETDHFSTYVLAEKTATSESNKDNEQKETSAKEDNTKALGSLPKAGAGISLTIVIIAVIVISVLAYIKYKNLKDI